MERIELISFGLDYASRQSDRILTESERLLLEGEALRNKMVIGRLFSEQITPAAAARMLEGSFRRQDLGANAVVDRLASYHQMFQEGDFALTQRQMVAWDDMLICLEGAFDIPEEERISRNRLVPVGTPSYEPDFSDLSF